MIQLPQTVGEAEARAYLREQVAYLRDADLFGLGVPTLHPEAGHIFVRQQLKLIAMSNPPNMMWVIDNARAGWDEADAALRELANEYIHVHKLPPVPLAHYMMELLRDHPKTRGPKKAAHALQDLLIAGMVAGMYGRFGLKPTRNKNARRRVSLCDLVADAINEAGWFDRLIEYKRVEQLWLRYGVWLVPGLRATR